MKLFPNLLLWSVALLFKVHRTEQTLIASENDAGPNRLQVFVASHVVDYDTYVMRLRYDVPTNLFRGGGVASNYIVQINDTIIQLNANWSQAPEVLQSSSGSPSIRIRFNNFLVFDIDGTYTLQGLQSAEPVFGDGTFRISSILSELNFYYFYDVDNTDHIVIQDAYSYYSNYIPASFSFLGTNSSDETYQRSFASAITEFTLKNLLTIYHQTELMEFLKCVFEKITLEQIEHGGNVESYLCLQDFVSEPTESTALSPTTPTVTVEPTELPVTTTTTIRTTTTLTTTSAPPDINFNCTGQPDGYYPHPANCSLFLGCLNGNLLQFSCPTFLLFHPQRLTCVHSNEYSCPVKHFDCEGLADGYYATVDCARYVGCLDGMLYKELTCPNDYYFDQGRQQCVPPMESECRRRFELFEETHQHFVVNP